MMADFCQGLNGDLPHWDQAGFEHAGPMSGLAGQ
jgi:hypothetical protein